jgi:sulfofructosephosphate aldolase
MRSLQLARVAKPLASAGPIDVFRDGHGLFTMVAVDQRESLRHMLSVGREQHVVGDDELTEFKAVVTEAISTTASGVLLDRDFGLPAAQRAHCPVILAADVLSSSEPGGPGGPVDTAVLDPEVTEETIAQFGAAALKFLLPWHPARRSQAVDLAHAFMARCRELGLPGVLEGVVRPREGYTVSREGFAEALVTAAADLAASRPDLYKTEVVYTSHDDRQLATATASSISEILSCPWVVLSSGVHCDNFPAAAAAAAKGGASGFRAGRAVWSHATQAADPVSYLRLRAPRNLQAITERVRAAS